MMKIVSMALTPLAFLAACNSDATQRTDAPTAPAPTAPAEESPAVFVAPGLEIMMHAPASGMLAGRDLQAKAGSTIEWKILSSSGNAYGAPGEVVVFRARSDSRHGASLAIDEGADQTLHIDGAEVGEPVMPVTDAHADESMSRFDPPLMLGRAEVAPQQSVEATSAMVVESLSKSGKVRDRGTATRTLKFEADETIRTPLGELACQRVEIIFKADLQFAKATVETTRWILPGVGSIAEHERKKIVVLGLVSRVSERVMVRTTPLQWSAP